MTFRYKLLIAGSVLAALLVLFLARPRPMTPVDATSPSAPAVPASESEARGAVPATLVRRDVSPRPASAQQALEARVQLATVSGAPLASIQAPVLAMIPPASAVVTKEIAEKAEAVPEVITFCPFGATERNRQARGGKEIWCVRTDKGGISYKEGPYAAWYSGGRKKALGAYFDGRASGVWTEFHANGVKSGDGEYRAGKRSGTWTFYWESGRKSSEGSYREGVKNGRWVFYTDAGKKESEGSLSTDDNVEHEQGRWTYWHANGKKKSEGSFKDGRRDGKWTEWDARGNVVTVDKYRDGDKS